MKFERQLRRTREASAALALAILMGIGTSRTAMAQMQIETDPNGPDPAAANMAPADAAQGGDPASYPTQQGTVQQGSPDAMQQPG